MPEMTDNTIRPDRVLLAAADLGKYDMQVSLDELEELVQTAGGEVVARVVQKRPTYDSACCIGTGRLEEMAELCKQLDVSRIVFGCETLCRIRLYLHKLQCFPSKNTSCR